MCCGSFIFTAVNLFVWWLHYNLSVLLVMDTWIISIVVYFENYIGLHLLFFFLFFLSLSLPRPRPRPRSLAFLPSCLPSTVPLACGNSLARDLTWATTVTMPDPKLTVPQGILDFSLHKFVKTCFVGLYIIYPGECSVCAKKKCIFWCCWREHCIYVYYVNLFHNVIQVCSFLIDFHYWKWGFEVPVYYCITVYLLL